MYLNATQTAVAKQRDLPAHRSDPFAEAEFPIFGKTSSMPLPTQGHGYPASVLIPMSCSSCNSLTWKGGSVSLDRMVSSLIQV